MTHRPGFGRFLLLILGVAVAWVVSTLPVWTIQEITVRGARHISVDDILERAAVPDEQNLIWLSSSAVRRRLLADPHVASVRVIKRYPSWLILEVKERDPYAVVMVGSRSHVIDQEGHVLFSLTPQTAGSLEASDDYMTASRLPVIRGNFSARAMAGRRLAPDVARAIRVALSAVLPLLPGRTVQLEYRFDEGIFLLVDDTMGVQIGSVDHMDEKVGALQLVMERLGPEIRRVASIDVRVPAFPTVRFRT